MSAQDAEPSAQKALAREAEATGSWDDVRVQDLSGPDRDRYGRRKLRYNAPRSNTDEDWPWAKMEGKKPAVDDEGNERGFAGEDIQEANLMSMGVMMEDAKADDEASLDHQYFDGRVVNVPTPFSTPPIWVPSGFGIDGAGFLTSDLERALQESMLKIQTPFTANGNNSGSEGKWFLRTDPDRAIAQSLHGPSLRRSERSANGRRPLPGPKLSTATLVSARDEENDLDEEGFPKANSRERRRRPYGRLWLCDDLGRARKSSKSVVGGHRNGGRAKLTATFLHGDCVVNLLVLVVE
ncbi:hypothetical protein FRC00_001702 [Tulasnella sp. 408]|nr:hypothetical protein FRC00_001702 [Tulasnella sp. 408]